MTTSDLGNTGIGGPLNDVDSMQIDITAINDPPFNSGVLPVELTVSEDVLSELDMSAVNIVDTDSGSNALTVTLSIVAIKPKILNLATNLRCPAFNLSNSFELTGCYFRV